MQSFRPPMDLDAFQYDDPQNVIDLMNEWEALQEHLTPDVAAQRYTRLLAVQSSELEEVFSLGAESLPRIVRAGFYSGAIDRVRHGPPGGVRAIAEILRDFNRVRPRASFICRAVIDFERFVGSGVSQWNGLPVGHDHTGECPHYTRGTHEILADWLYACTCNSFPTNTK